MKTEEMNKKLRKTQEGALPKLPRYQLLKYPIVPNSILN